MPLSSKKNFPRLVSLTLIFVFLALGFTTGKHLLSSGKPRWVTRAHEMRRIGYHAERLNLRSAVNAEEDAPLSDFVRQVVSIPLVPNAPISASLVSSARQRAEDLENSFRDRSPVLNL